MLYEVITLDTNGIEAGGNVKILQLGCFTENVAIVRGKALRTIKEHSYNFV